MDDYTFLNANDPAVLESLYQQFKNNPDQTDPQLRRFFEGFDFAVRDYASRPGEVSLATGKEFKVIRLIEDYRKRGHLFTKTNPVRKRRTYTPSLD
ncbi:MAG TPA: hypothetical protein PLC47_01830, partial [Bacteroidales bacterium]|nr:hypothetical protein [Bacteroidales bacterium]